MKKLLLSFIPLLSFCLLSSCTKGGETGDDKLDVFTANIAAIESSTWHYYCLTEKKVVGTGEENQADNEKWGKLSNWDIAIKKYEIKTNSGTSSSVSAQGGEYTFDENKKFADVTELPSGITFMADKLIKESGMDGKEKTTSKSTAEVIRFKRDEAGDKIMPPIYLKAPVYIFRTDDGKKYYKIEFTQYENAEKVKGYVEFSAAEIR